MGSKKNLKPMDDTILTTTDELGVEYSDKVVNPDTNNWIVCDYLPDTGALKGSVLDMSWTLDAPAGKHGFIKRTGDRFEFEDGTPARFWGGNVVAWACFFEKEEADELVERVACAGFNLVRFHHMDASWVKPNIFGVNKTTRTLDPVTLDRFEYLWAEFKKRGIYFMIDPLCTRVAIEEFDGIEANPGFKSSSLFSEKLQELQKEYATQLFNHVNPYTGTALKDDPALVFVDIINEDSLFWGNAATWAMKERKWHYDNFNSIFTDWLKERYSSTKELANAWNDNEKEGLCDRESLESVVTVPLDFNTDGLEKLSVKKLTDIRRFAEELHRKYYEKFLKFYREEIGLKCMICGSNAPTYPDVIDLYANTACGADFLDQHSYYGGTAWGRFWLEDNLPLHTVGESSFSDINRTMLDTFQEQRVYGVPYVQSEWNQVEPNLYSAESLPIMAAYSSLCNWNPIFFAFLQDKMPKEPKLYLTFNAYEIPTKYSILPICSLMRNRGDISESETGYYVNIGYDDSINNQNYDKRIPRDMKRITKTGIIFEDVESCKYDFEAENRRLVDYLENNSKDGVLKSVTGELFWHTGKGLVIDTEYTCAVVGFMSDRAYDTQFAVFETQNPHSSVIISSLGCESLKKADKLLLSAVGGWRMTGEKFTSDARMILKAGEMPMLVEPIIGKVLLKTQSDFDVYCLDFSGRRVNKCETEKTTDGFIIHLSGDNKALNYEIIRK